MNVRLIAVIAALLLAACASAATGPPDDFGRPAGPFLAADDAAAYSATANGDVFVDVAPHPEVEADGRVMVAGWAFVPPGTPCETIGLVVDRHNVLSGAYGTPRGDVADTFVNYQLYWSGYSVSVPARSLGRGRHDVYIVCKGRNGQMLRNPVIYPVLVR